MAKLDGLKQGKKSLGSMFKSAEKKEKDQAQLETEIRTAETDIEDYRRLVTYLNFYMNDVAIVAFKKTKHAAYL